MQLLLKSCAIQSFVLPLTLALVLPCFGYQANRINVLHYQEDHSTAIFTGGGSQVRHVNRKTLFLDFGRFVFCTSKTRPKKVLLSSAEVDLPPTSLIYFDIDTVVHRISNVGGGNLCLRIKSSHPADCNTESLTEQSRTINLAPGEACCIGPASYAIDKLCSLSGIAIKNLRTEEGVAENTYIATCDFDNAEMIEKIHLFTMLSLPKYRHLEKLINQIRTERPYQRSD